MKREDYALVLDYLPYGKSGEAVKEPLAIVLGDSQFTLLEVVLKPGLKVDLFEKIYIGSDSRDKVDHIKQRIEYSHLTSGASRELDDAVKLIVKTKEAEFVNFLNKAGSLSIRSHSLEQLPSIGKKHLSALLTAREKTPFTSFEDVQKRVPHLINVEDIFVQRIVSELKGGEKYFLFTKPPRREERY
ncbi:DUF655 domain-containing protein [Candidatus Micrarchaeota archaeon]|nr:DUF655 domain-containing protein [Candidatus Micrarchaeota archaeon]